MQIAQRIADRLNIDKQSTLQTIKLLNGGASIPFIARYRKELTGSLDEIQIASIQDAQEYFENLEKRRAAILASIDDQGLLTSNLEQQILACKSLIELEDLYIPYKAKRKTKADLAKEMGLEPLARIIFEQKQSLHTILIDSYINEQLKTREEILQAARDIIAEWINIDPLFRNWLRANFERKAVISSTVKKKKERDGNKYKDYFNFQENLNTIPSHRLLALLRGEEEGYLKLKIAIDPDHFFSRVEQKLIKSSGLSAKQIKLALIDAYDRLLLPSIETEVRSLCKEKADEQAIEIFCENIRQLLMAAPLGEKNILAVDPGFRTGCKIACIDKSGKYLDSTEIYPLVPRNETHQAIEKVNKFVSKYSIEAIAIGNGTAGRETMNFFQSHFSNIGLELFFVNESGASIYSASEVARDEFAALDLTIRGAISIGRRLMDPLAELVKIDPKSIGVGQYQHDVNQKKLKLALERMISYCVNQIGVNLNTASEYLLKYISGLGPVLARNIVEYRNKNGLFKQRSDLKLVSRMGDKAFEQSAGFLRIRNSVHPLDNTGIHPERYDLVERMAMACKCTLEEMISDSENRNKIKPEDFVDEVAGWPTIRDILVELDKPGFDPRGKAQVFQFENIHSISDVNIGMQLPGIVTNITQFGVFVDIGIKDSAFIHVSNLAEKFVKNPMEIVRIQQKIELEIIDLDIDRKRISCSLLKTYD